jgi:hypothetical protein
VATTVQSLLDDIANEGSFDATPGQALRWLDRRHRLMVARSLCVREKRAATATLDSADALSTVDLTGVGEPVEIWEVTAGTLRFSLTRHGDLAAYAEGLLAWTGTDGLVVVEGSSLILWPALDDAATVEVFAAWEAATLTAADSVAVDDESVEGLLAGVFATALSRPNEARPDLAAYYEDQFATACEEQRLRTRRRLKGAGVKQVRLDGSFARHC